MLVLLYTSHSISAMTAGLVGGTGVQHHSLSLANAPCVSALPNEMGVYLCLGYSRAARARARQDTLLRFGMCLYPAPSLATNTVQISNIRGRNTSQIVLRFQELIMFSREQRYSPSSAVGQAVGASSHS